MRTRSAFRIMATAALAIIILFPFLYALLASFFAASDFATSPARFIPEIWKTSNYSRIAANRYFPTYVVNSVLTGLMSTTIRMVVAFLASYAFSHFRFKGDSACLAFIILTLFIPSDLLLSGNYMTIQKLGLLDTYAGIISTSLLPASQILMLRQYFRSIPGSIRDSAMMDGCSDERYILSILLPISRALVSTFLLQGFVGMFNSYLWPLLVTNSPSVHEDGADRNHDARLCREPRLRSGLRRDSRRDRAIRRGVHPDAQTYHGGPVQGLHVHVRRKRE